MRKIIDWVKWEFSRELEVTPFIRFITFERFVKGFVLIVGGIILLVVGAKTDLHRLAEEVQTQYNLNPGRGWWRHLYESTVVRFGNAPRTQTEVIAIGAIAYGLLEVLEGVGLVLRRRWAEYLVLVATLAFVPLEVDELFRKPTVFKGIALLINLLIVGYLVWRKRLFLERPGGNDPDNTVPIPADLMKRRSVPQPQTPSE